MQKITTLAQLQALLSQDFYQNILNQAKAGDPDWLHDIIQELDIRKPGDNFYLAEFHGVLQPLGYTSADFDTTALMAELPAHDPDFTPTIH